MNARVPLVPYTSPQLNEHLEIELWFSNQDGSGLPTDRAEAELDVATAAVVAALGPHGELVAHETSGGARTLHAYVDGGTPPIADVVDAAATWTGGESEVRAGYDPTWSGVAHLRF